MSTSTNSNALSIPSDLTPAQLTIATLLATLSADWGVVWHDGFGEARSFCGSQFNIDDVWNYTAARLIRVEYQPCPF